MSRRAKIVLDRVSVADALGLKGMRVVAMHVTHDPDTLHAEVEGPGVPVLSGRLDRGDHATLAWQGLIDAPVMRWPQPAGPRGLAAEWADPEGAAQRVRERVDEEVAASVNAQAPAPERVDACQVNVRRVDETVGGGDLEDVPPLVSAMNTLSDAAAAAAKLGAEPFALIGAVQGAIRAVEAERREDVRRDLLETTERTLSLVRRHLGEQDAA